MAEIIRVKVFDFINTDQNFRKRFDRKDIEDFLNDNKTKLYLKNGKYNSLLSHRSRLTSKDVVGNDLYDYISPNDAPLINKDIAGIIKKMFIKNNDFIVDIQLLPNECGKFVSMLLAAGVKLSVSISFLDCSDRESPTYSIYELNGVDITIDPAFKSAEIIGVI